MALDTNFRSALLAFAVGVYLYAQGFLLNRKEINDVNERIDFNQSYNGAVIIVIDALKFDFVDPRLRKTEGHWAGNLESVRNVLDKYPNNARLFHFEADPPTTTLQRLKGLTTGSFPTFIDASSNFGGSAIVEDNLITQLNHAGKTIAFYGDDTWLQLFPKQFTTAYPYESFDVMDLDTVDEGVLSHLRKYLDPKFRWPDVTIAHFLGVDHCGHRYGQNHPEMRRKLLDMDSVIRNAIDGLPDDKLLLVMGDHGMTSTGDHGGDSRSEVDAALFVYSKKGFSPLRSTDHYPNIHQIDLVPTLALLLGIPIPFSNLGQTYSTFYPNLTVAKRALQSNMDQVKNYLKKYQYIFKDLPPEDVESFNRQYKKLSSRNGTDFSLFEDEVTKLLFFIKQTCREKWTAFNLSNIFAGMFMMSCALVCLSPLRFHMSFTNIFCLVLSGLTSLIISNPFIAIFFPILFLLWLFISLLQRVGDMKRLFNSSFVMRLIVLLFVGNCGIYFSNSFIVNEQLSLNLILQTMIFCLFIVNLSKALQEKKVELQRKCRLFDQVILPYCLAAISLRCAGYFVICREEQQPFCIAENISRPISSFDDDFISYKIKSWRCGLSTITMFIIGFLHMKWLQGQGNVNGNRPAMLCTGYAVPLIAFGAIMNLFIDCYRRKKHDQLAAWLVVTPIRVSFLLGVVSLIILYVKPLMISVIKQRPMLSIEDCKLRRPNSIVPLLWNHLKEQFNASKDGSVMVHGQGTIFTSTFSVTLSLLTIIFVSLLGDGFLYPLILLYVTFLSVSSMIHKASSEDQDYLVSIIFSVVSHYFFYCLGHQPTLSNIPWHAAFVGLRGNHSYRILPAIFILLNLFSSFILVSFLLPITIVCQYTPEINFMFIRIGLSTQRGEMAIFDAKENDPEHDFLFRLRRRYKSYIFCGALMALSSMIAAVHHRRHLMVWKIFAPRMMFCVVSLGGTLFGSALGYILAKSIFNSYLNFKQMLDRSDLKR